MTDATKAPARIVVAGAGMIGLEHIKRIQALPQAELAGIVGSSPKSQAQAGSLSVPWASDIPAIARDHQVDGVVVALPNQLHFAAGMECIEAGLPALIEKPVCSTVEEGFRLAEASEQADVPILVGHHHRHNAAVLRAKELIASGALGQIIAVNGMTWFLKPKEYFEGQYSWRREPGSGVVLQNLIHVMDDLRNLCGDIASVQAAGSNAARGFVVEDTVAIILRFKNGALGTLAISDTVASPWNWEMTSGELKWFPRTNESCYFVGGTQASISLPRLEVWTHSDGAWFTPIESRRVMLQEQDSKTLEPITDPFYNQMSHFCDVIRREAKPRIDARSGARSLEATLAVLTAASSGGIVELS